MAVPKGRQAAFLALNRFGFGARPGDLEAITGDPLGALRSEARTEAVAQPSGADLVTSGEAAGELVEFQTARKIARDKLAAAEAVRQQGEEPQAAPAAGDAMPGRATPAPKPMRPQQRFFRAETLARVEAARAARIGFAERLVWFWSNHFCVSLRKGGLTSALVGPYEREAIRPHVFGRFEEMLLAVERHPAMLAYLDNARSIGPNSRAGIRRDKGLNENLARENLELHTLGVDGGYTQDDVVNVARAFTGWTMRPMQGAAFRFVPGMHDRTEKVVLGHRITAGGIGDGRAVLDILAAHPSTARHLATKLAQKFVSDTPPPALVDRAARTFLESHGDLRAVTRVIVTSPELLSAEARGAKIKTPFEFVVSAVRATGADLRSALPLARVLRDLGQPLYFCQPPTGYDETGDTWVSSGALVARMNFALELGANRLRGVRLDTSGSLDELRDRLVADALGGSVSDTTRATLAKATTPEQVVALAIGSPEFQRQ